MIHPERSAPDTSLAVRARASATHLMLCLLVAGLAAWLVFALWYPTPFRDISGGRELFLLVVAVDVVIGPVITFVVFNRNKPRAELIRDLAFVAALQLAALAYGLHSVAQARPAVLALEGDRLRAVRAVDLADADFNRAPEGLRSLSWTGPRLLAARPPTTAEKLDAIERGLAGQDIGMRPMFWRPPAETGPACARAAKPLALLIKRRPERAPDLQRAVQATGRDAETLGYLPILARRTDWSALVDRSTGEVVGYVDIEGF